MTGRTLRGGSALAACIGMLAFAMAAHAAAPRLDWSGFAGARLGVPPAAKAASLGHGITVVCTGGGKVSDVHTTVRGAAGPLGVRVGMSDRALRKALGRRSLAFKLRGRRGRLLVGPKRHVLWALAVSARRQSVGAFGVAISRQVARGAARSKPCALPPVAAAPPAPADTAAPAQETPPSTSSAGTDTPTTTTTAPPECPATLPKVRPYMRVACDASTGNRVAYTCHPDWLDTNQDPADGCEAEKDGLATMWFTPDSSQALADHILGAFAMGGYGYSTLTNGPAVEDWGAYDGFVNPIAVPVSPDCGSDPSVDCAGGQPADAARAVDLDLARYANDSARSYVTMSGTTSSTGLPFMGAGVGTTEATAGGRFRLTTESPIQLTHSGVTCNVSIDSTQGTIPDLTLDATLSKATDPDTGQGDDGPPQVSNVTISNLQSSDYTLSPATSADFLCFGSAFISTQNVVAALQPALTNWFKAATRLCGTAGPYWWEPCPPSVDVAW